MVGLGPPLRGNKGTAMKLNLNFLSEDEKHRIHRDSLKILSRVGVKYSKTA
jgi:trimethylamine:corrinoid methyltransferase-like protein